MRERPALGSIWPSHQHRMVIEPALAANPVASQLSPDKMSYKHSVSPGEQCSNYQPPPGGGPLLNLLKQEHTLPFDTLNIVCGPPALHMYDTDPPDCKQALLSPGCQSNISENLSSPTTAEAFDLKPHFEDSNPDLLKVYLGISRSNSDQDLHALDHLCIKLEEDENHQVDSANLSTSWQKAFKMEQDIGEPTLAELNNDNTTVMSLTDDLELRYPGDGNCKFGVNNTNSVLTQQGLNSLTAIENMKQNDMVGSNLRGQVMPCTVTMSSSLKEPNMSSGNVPRSNGANLPSKVVGDLQRQMLSGQTKIPVTGHQQHVGVVHWPESATGSQQATSTLQGLLKIPPIIIKPDVDLPILQTVATSGKLFKNKLEADNPPHVAGMKRSLSPDGESVSSTNSEEAKWAEIKEFIESEKKSGAYIMPTATQACSSSSINASATSSTMEQDTPRKKSCSVADVYNIGDQQSDDEDNNDSMDNDSDPDPSEDDDDISDAESETNYSSFSEEFLKTTRKDKRFFWQYNTQAKGPKGKRLCKSMETEDPHVLHDFEDPVFDTEIHNMQYKHNGRARRGDGNDINPNPWKLFQIGNELSKLNRKIHMMGSGQELPAQTRNKTRREKNKFASRACRLKKKAQHEAHKLKLFGLEQEHLQLMTVLDNIKVEVRERAISMKGGATTFPETMVDIAEGIKKKHLTVMIAGNTTDYVTSVLEKVAKGDRTGGIHEL